MIRFLFLGLLLATQAVAETKKEPAIPYLGPGSDKLSAEEYQKVYKSYIQSSALLGYPFLKESAPACDHALTTIFRNAGFFGYPVPKDSQVKQATKSMGGRKVETYESGGVLIQLARAKNNGAPEQLIWVNSSSTKALRRLSGFAKNELLKLEKDPVTGLETVRGTPVGFPHPLLGKEGQGLFVKALRFNAKIDGCEPLEFQDNAWVGGFDLSDARCTELQVDVEKVWEEKISPQDFSENELKRMKAIALKSALAKGTKPEEAKALIEKHFQAPFASEINVVGSAMRNLAQCNLLALGRAGKVAPSSPAKSETAPPASGTGSAQ